MTHKDQRFTQLFSDTRDILSRYVRRLVRSPFVAEEIVQEAYLRTFATSTRPNPVRPYLFSVARNLAFKVRRHDKVVDAFAALDVQETMLRTTSDSAEEAVLADERIRLLDDAIRGLPPQCRAAFTLRMFQDRSYKDIAAHLGISAKTVEKHIALGVKQVHAVMSVRYREGEHT